MTRDAHVITCTIGRKPSNARYFLNEPTDVSSLFENLSAIKPERSEIKQRKLRPNNTRNDFDWFQGGKFTLSDNASEEGGSDGEKKSVNKINRAMTISIPRPKANKMKGGKGLYGNLDDEEDDILVGFKDIDNFKFFKDEK